MLGVVVGILSGELVMVVSDANAFTLALATFIAMAVTRAFRGTRIMTIQAASGASRRSPRSPPGSDPGLDRLVDALIGAAVAFDADGGVWVALNTSGTVRRYTAAGRMDEVVEVPTPKVTACAVGGDALDELFITTSREGLGPDDEPLAGAVFSVRVGVPGPPTREFTG